MIFGKHSSRFIYLNMVGFPCLLLPFLMLRRARTNAAEAECNRRQDELVSRVTRTVNNYRLIADYNVRPFFVSWYESVIKAYNGAATDAAAVLLNNNYFSPWITKIL